MNFRTETCFRCHGSGWIAGGECYTCEGEKELSAYRARRLRAWWFRKPEGEVDWAQVKKLEEVIARLSGEQPAAAPSTKVCDDFDKVLCAVEHRIEFLQEFLTTPNRSNGELIKEDLELFQTLLLFHRSGFQAP